MKLYFLESGIDSLKKGFDYLIKYEESTFIKRQSKNKDYFLKDSILFIQHGIEILLKQILISHSEYLIFSQIDESVKKAYKEKQDKNLNSVFESSFKNKLHTVSFSEAIDRTKMTAKFKLSINLEKKIRELESYRNIIMHSEVHLNETEINETFDGLFDDLDTFFLRNLGPKYKTISGYSTLLRNYGQFKELLSQKNLETKSKAIDILLDIFSRCEISIGVNEIRRITNPNTATKIFEILFNASLRFGTDLYNGYCSGDVRKIERIGEKEFSMFTADNNAYFDFTFKSLLLFIPDIASPASPIIFIESDNQKINDSLKPFIFEYDKISTLNSLYLKNEKKHIYEPDVIEEIEEDNHIDYADYERHTRFFTKGLFCFINIQGLEYNRNYKSLIYNEKFIDGKEFEVIFRKIVIKK